MKMSNSKITNDSGQENIRKLSYPKNLSKLKNIDVENRLETKINNTDNKQILSNIQNDKEKIRLRKKKTCLLKNELTDITTRKDHRGIPILKGNKNYRVSFKDFVTKLDLVEYLDLESYKILNLPDIKSEPPPQEEKNDNTSCSCLVF